MKTLTIYQRTILERTGYRKHPYAEKTETLIYYATRRTPSMDYPNYRVQFHKVFESRSLKSLEAFLDKIPNRTNAQKDMKAQVSALLLKEGLIAPLKD